MKQIVSNTFLYAGAFFALFLLPIPSDASIVSVKSMGRAGAVVARPLDSLAAAYNPAGLAWVGDRWDLGLSVIEENGKTRFSGNDTFNKTIDSHNYQTPLFVPEFGVTQNICEREYQYDFTLGFVVYNRDFFKTKYDKHNSLYGTSKLGMEYLHYVAAPSCSIKFGCDHALGITADFHGHRLNVTGLENFATSTYSKHPHAVTNEGYDYAGGIGFTVGWTSRLSPWATIGLAWSPKVTMGRLSDYKGLLAEQGKWDIPARYAGGVAIDLSCGVIAEFDVEHFGYTEIPALNNSFLHHNALAPYFGKDHGSGWGWRGQTNFNLGLEMRISECFSARVGYRHTHIAIRGSQALHNALIPNIVENYATIGATAKFDGCNEISFFAGYGSENSVSGLDAIPASLGSGKVLLTEKNWQAGLSWGHFF